MMTQYNIEYTKNSSPSDIDFLTKQINQETSEYGEAYPFAFFMRDDAAEIIAGANGFVSYCAIYTDQLWVELPLGADFNTAVYLVTTTDKIGYFLKLRSGDFRGPSVLVPHHPPSLESDIPRDALSASFVSRRVFTKNPERINTPLNPQYL